MNSAAQAVDVSEEDRLRADLYNFLGLLLARPADQLLLDQTAALTGDESDLGAAINGLARVAKASTPAGVEREFTRLFIGLGRGELLPYASYYLTGFLNEKPLAKLRNDMAALQITRAENTFEPEDGMAAMMEMMGGMIVGRFGPSRDLEAQRGFFNNHIAPWATHFYSDLEGATSSVFYAGVGTVGRTFMEIEKEAFRMTAG
ncbi:TorD/DmsD family molecular chaperone [Roseobacter sinensis]|uniref:Molecular chaperone TorD family protein n=1 Tax=Roseobacter sinensis TaxID=2931391 RepID=A0ABT3BHP5_9RHOB|nr:molecular chaperone TorD family protein [Roseobacter sp. WL0113]MCV3273097.1 molecular chaperone TorD family protein [Roseobacter sp. WL0113]